MEEKKRNNVEGIEEVEPCQLVFSSIFPLYRVLTKSFTRPIGGTFMSSLFTSILRQCEIVFRFAREVAALNRKNDRVLVVFAYD
jgi:hypothetical protein